MPKKNHLQTVGWMLHSLKSLRKMLPGTISAGKTGAMLLLFFLRSSGQDWQTGRLDTFLVEKDGKLVLESRDEFGYVLQAKTPPSYPSRYWVDVDLWVLTSPGNTEEYFLFGSSDSTGSRQLWAAGYSLAQKHIIVATLDIDDANVLYLREIARKTVEIINRENKYVFRTIFHHDRNEIIFEVNGVPLKILLPIASRKMIQFGLMIRGGKVRFSALRWDGE